MKVCLLAVVAISMNLYSAEFIVKFKPKQVESKNLKSFGIKRLKTKILNFSKVNLSNRDELKKLQADPNVEYIEPNYTYYASSLGGNKFAKTLSDPGFSKQWGLKAKPRRFLFWKRKGFDINVFSAWKKTKGDETLKIAVVDTGVDYNHPDLKENILVNELEQNGIEGVDDDGNGYVDDVFGYDFANGDSDPQDGNGHGTHCAGVIGAGHNGLGIAGVMSKVKILPIKFLTDFGSGSLEGAIKAIDYAIARGVHIMSNSWGGGGRSQALFEAIQRAQEAGIVFVAAAGNENNNNDTFATYPAGYKLDNVISVGAMDRNGKRASFSNYGKKSVHVFAPGVDIFSTVPNGKYESMSGTSMATPMVSGVVGLLLSSEPNLSPSEVKNRLMRTAKKIKGLKGKSQSGLVDAARAL